MKIKFDLTISDSEYDRLLCEYIQARGGDSLLGQTYGADLDALLDHHLNPNHSLPMVLDTSDGTVVFNFGEMQL